MKVILPSLRSNYLIFSFLKYFEAKEAYIIMRSLNKLAFEKTHKLRDFVEPCLMNENFRKNKKNYENLVNLKELNRKK